MNDSQVVTVRSLVGADQAELAGKCLGSLLAAARRPVRLAIHDDGTLDAPARERLFARLGPTCQFVDRAEASGQVAERLRAHPRCARFRQEHVFGPKLFDIPLLATGRVVYIDSDILWTRPADCPAYFAGGSLPFVVMRDLKESYAVSLRSWTALRRHGIPLVSRFCAGMMSFDARAHDLDYLEWLLGVDEQHALFGGFRFWAEQTMYAALAARAGCAWIDPAECVVAHRRNFARSRRAAVIHFAGFSRNLFEARYREINFAECSSLPVKTLGTRRAPRCGWGRRIYSALRTRAFLRETDPATRVPTPVTPARPSLQPTAARNQPCPLPPNS